MRLGETIATYDVGLALRGKSGKFEVTSPTGEIYQVTCKSSHSISDLEWSSSGTDQTPFLIRRVTEAAAQGEPKTPGSETVEQESQTASSPLPFVRERAAEDGDSSGVGNLELLYLEDNPETGQPSACVYLKGNLPADASDGVPMTSRCATLNELDSEIRRLQARLDEIRCRAKKMFYKTQAFAASA